MKKIFLMLLSSLFLYGVCPSAPGSNTVTEPGPITDNFLEYVPQTPGRNMGNTLTTDGEMAHNAGLKVIVAMINAVM